MAESAGEQVYGPFHAQAKALHALDPEFFPDPEAPGTAVVGGAELSSARRECQLASQQGLLPKGHHRQGLAFGGTNHESNIAFTGESTIQASALSGVDMSFYAAQGIGKLGAKVYKIWQEAPGGLFLFGLNPRHARVTNFQNEVLRWQKESGMR